MKHSLIISFLVIALTSQAQVPFPTMDSLNINNITAAILVHGDMWFNPATNSAYCHFPSDSQNNISSIGSIWMSGYDAGNNLHIAAQTYRQSGIDYWPGPLDGSDTLTYSTSSDWAKIWKINKTDIQSFLDSPTHTIANTPESILTWPGKGNAYAQGNAGVSLTITTDMAPFIDLNGNGIYEPLLGEYPAIPGDQAAWWVFSDNGPTHSTTNGNPLGVEVHAMSYGYKRGTLIDDVVYYEYDITNRSSNNYTNFRIAQWGDPEYRYDDKFIGFDSIWRMGIVYFGTNCDGCSAGHPFGVYGYNPPQSAVTMIVLPGDIGTSYQPVGSFTYYDNNNSFIGNPLNDIEFNNYMRAKMSNGAHFTDDFQGPGIPCAGYGTGPNCNYVFPGDPSDTSNASQWSECKCKNSPDDLRYVLSSNDFTLNSGATQKIVMALIVADTARGCDSTSFNDISIVADTAWGVYYSAAVNNVPSPHSLNIYPNPAHDKLYIENTGLYTGEETIIVYNTLGQMVNIPLNKSGQKYVADISGLADGMYFVQYRNDYGQVSAKFLKE